MTQVRGLALAPRRVAASAIRTGPLPIFPPETKEHAASVAPSRWYIQSELRVPDVTSPFRAGWSVSLGA